MHFSQRQHERVLVWTSVSQLKWLSHHRLNHSSVFSMLKSRNIHRRLSFQISLSCHLCRDQVVWANGSCSLVPWMFWCHSFKAVLSFYSWLCLNASNINTLFGPVANLSLLSLFIYETSLMRRMVSVLLL